MAEHLNGKALAPPVGDDQAMRTYLKVAEAANQHANAFLLHINETIPGQTPAVLSGYVAALVDHLMDLGEVRGEFVSARDCVAILVPAIQRSADASILERAEKRHEKPERLDG